MLYFKETLNLLEVACNLQKYFLGGILMKKTVLMQGIIHQAFLTGEKVKFTLTNGDVIEDTIVDYDEFIILTRRLWHIRWCNLCNVTFS